MKQTEKMAGSTYIGNEKDDNERVGDLAPKDFVPLDTAVALELVGAMEMKASICLFGGEALDGAGLELGLRLCDSVSVVGNFWLKINDFFNHGGKVE